MMVILRVHPGTGRDGLIHDVIKDVTIEKEVLRCFAKLVKMTLEIIALTNGLVFFAPVAILVRTQASFDFSAFFMLQAVLALTILIMEIPSGMLTDKIGYKRTIVLSQVFLFLARGLLLLAFYR